MDRPTQLLLVRDPHLQCKPPIPSAKYPCQAKLNHIDARCIYILYYIYMIIYIYVYIYIYISMYLSLSIYIYIFIYLYLSIPIYLSIYLSILSYPSILLSFFLSIYPSIHLSIYPSIHLSIYPSIYLSIFIYVHTKRSHEMWPWFPAGQVPDALVARGSGAALHRAAGRTGLSCSDYE